MFLEFLEFIGRVSEKWLEETEMSDLPLYSKIEHFLGIMVPLVDATLLRQEVVIEEFSDSDDDY